VEVEKDDSIEQANFIFRPVNYGYSGYEKMNKRITTELLIYNHFEVLSGICTKSGLIRSLKKYYEHNREAKAAGYSIFDSTPTTYLVSMSKESSTLNSFVQRFNEISKNIARKERVP